MLIPLLGITYVLVIAGPSEGTVAIYFSHIRAVLLSTQVSDWTQRTDVIQQSKYTIRGFSFLFFGSSNADCRPGELVEINKTLEENKKAWKSVCNNTCRAPSCVGANEQEGGGGGGYMYSMFCGFGLRYVAARAGRKRTVLGFGGSNVRWQYLRLLAFLKEDGEEEDWRRLLPRFLRWDCCHYSVTRRSPLHCVWTCRLSSAAASCSHGESKEDGREREGEGRIDPPQPPARPPWSMEIRNHQTTRKERRATIILHAREKEGDVSQKKNQRRLSFWLNAASGAAQHGVGGRRRRRRGFLKWTLKDGREGDAVRPEFGTGARLFPPFLPSPPLPSYDIHLSSLTARAVANRPERRRASRTSLTFSGLKPKKMVNKKGRDMLISAPPLPPPSSSISQ